MQINWAGLLRCLKLGMYSSSCWIRSWLCSSLTSKPFFWITEFFSFCTLFSQSCQIFFFNWPPVVNNNRLLVFVFSYVGDVVCNVTSLSFYVLNLCLLHWMHKVGNMQLSGSYKSWNRTFYQVGLLHHCSDPMKTVKGMVENGLKWKQTKKKDVALIAGYPVQVGEIGKRRNIWELCSCERNKALQNTFWAAWEHWTNNPEPVKLHLHESMWHTCCTLLYPPAMAGAGYRPCVQDAGWAAVSSHGNCCLMGLQGEQAHDSSIPGGPANLATQSWLRYSWREVSVGHCGRWQWAGRSGQTGRSLQPGLGTCGYCKGCEWKGPAWRCSHSSE